MIDNITTSERRLCRVVYVSVTTYVVYLSHGVDLPLLIEEHSRRHIDHLRPRVRLLDERVHGTAVALLQVVSTWVRSNSVWMLR